jgi:hypothetical protein
MAKHSKKEIEKVKAAEHKARMAEAKARRKQQPDLERATPVLEVKPTILIYCEGKNTEPSYFQKFRISSATVKIFGEGKNTLSLVQEAEMIANKAKDNGKPFEKVWCVFDADPKPDNPKQLENFNAAVAYSKKLGYGTAYTNQAFEYWLILHFEDHQGGSMLRTDYHSKLNSYLKPLGLFYDGHHSKKISKEIYEVLFETVKTDKNGKPVSRCDIATTRAQRIYDTKEEPRNPGNEESSTTVHLLVEELLGLK